MKINLKGKRALITGGTHGIGICCARRLSEAGCNVAVLGRTVDRLTDFSREFVVENNQNLALQCDVLKVEQCVKVCQTIDKLWGGVDILINNVGGGGRWGSENILETNQIIWDEVYQKNTGAQIHFTNHFLPFMRACNKL